MDADNVITNYTQSAVNTSDQFPTVGTIIGVAILLVILIALLIFAIRKMMGVSGASSDKSVRFDNSSGTGGFSGSDRSYS